MKTKVMRSGNSEIAISGSPRPDLLNYVDAISLALKNWNDTEALKLLRLHWTKIAQAVQDRESSAGISVSMPRKVRAPRRQVARFGDGFDGAPNGGPGIADSSLRAVPLRRPS